MPSSIYLSLISFTQPHPLQVQPRCCKWQNAGLPFFYFNGNKTFFFFNQKPLLNPSKLRARTVDTSDLGKHPIAFDYKPEASNVRSGALCGRSERSDRRSEAAKGVK